MTEKLLYDDSDGLEIVNVALDDAHHEYGRSLRAGELAGYIARGHIRYEFEAVDHLPRVRTLLERLVKKGTVGKERLEGFTYYHPMTTS